MPHIGDPVICIGTAERTGENICTTLGSHLFLEPRPKPRPQAGIQQTRDLIEGYNGRFLQCRDTLLSHNKAPNRIN